MKALLVASIIILVFVSAIQAQSPDSACHFFILKKAEKDLALERIALASGDVRVFQIKADGEYITPVIAIGGAGRSGELVKTADNHLVIAQCRQGELRIKFRQADGTEREMPARKMEILAQYNLRVSVTGKNIRKVFRVLQNERTEVDQNGPVIDMFGGKVPLSENDYLLTVETQEGAATKSVEGEAPIEYRGYLFTKVRLKGGREGDFVVDLAASHTVVAKSFLPSVTKLREVSAIEYSEKGKRNVEYLPGGAGGAVKGLSQAEIAELQIGSASFPNVVVDVLESLPRLADRQVDGIIGLDLLQRAQRISFGYPRNPSEPDKLILSGKSTLTKDIAVEIPFAIVTGDIMIKGMIGDLPLDFILDTGAPDSIVTSATAREGKITSREKATKPIFGLDGNPLQTKAGTIGRLAFGTNQYSDVWVTIADLPIFESKGLKSAGLLGNSFFQRFKRVEVDFVQSVIRLQS